MALTIPVQTNQVVTLDEYVEYVRRRVDLHDLDSLAASAPMLRALANDRRLVVQALNQRVENFLAGSPLSSAQALLLASGQDFYVRAGIWPAISDMANGRAYQNQFAYNLAHDHNFTFMTVSYLGPGYETDIYEYDYDKVEGFIGEPVDIRFLEKVKFAPGMVMLYRASRDVHVQYPPEELTITLNLMVAHPEVRIRDQYYFDLTKKVVAGYPNELQATGRASFVKIAGMVGDTNTQQLLNDLAAHHPCRRTRLTAFEALCRQRPAEAGTIWEKASVDPAPLVANAARRRLRQLESA